MLPFTSTNVKEKTINKLKKTRDLFLPTLKPNLNKENE
jgi:hypothetical protein